ncbi:ribonuclease H-like domain-containing protein [Tanacetum coccineum]
MKGIKREFSVAKTPQQNGVAERKNRTLIKAIRTMLVDSKMPTTFWAEAVNTACYVLNRVLVIKPHNKTPYELIRRRTPLIDFMKPFGFPVTILNTRDHLSKFERKGDEGFFGRYSMVSKVMRVFNKRTRIVEETLNIRFLENTPNVTGNGPDWLFDVDSLTLSMNYVPVITGNQNNGIAGKRDYIVASQAEKKKEPKQEYILIPFCITDPLIYQGPKDSEEDFGVKPIEVDKCEALDKDRKDEQDTRTENVDVHLYRSMIGSLMHLTAFRPDIMFDIYACARFQVTPKMSHLHAMKRIFRYLKGQPKLGLWYPEDSPFNLEAFSNYDYARASLDRKSTTGGCQFLGKRMISCQCKKQTIVANSTTEEEYVAAANCCG